MGCWRCHGRGYYLIANGPEDVDKELCEYCSEYREENENGTDEQVVRHSPRINNETE